MNTNLTVCGREWEKFSPGDRFTFETAEGKEVYRVANIYGHNEIAVKPLSFKLFLKNFRKEYAADSWFCFYFTGAMVVFNIWIYSLINNGLSLAFVMNTISLFVWIMFLFMFGRMVPGRGE